MTFEVVVLVLFSEAPLGPVVLYSGNFPFLVRIFFFFNFAFTFYADIFYTGSCTFRVLRKEDWANISEV